MTTDRRQNTYNARYGQQTPGAATASYMGRGPHGSQVADDMQNLASAMTSINLHAPYGNGAAARSGASVSSSEYAALPGQGLWVPNQHILGSMYQVLPGTHQHNGVTHAAGLYNHAGAFVPGAYPYGQAIADNSPMASGWTSRVSSSEMPSLMSPRRDSMSSNENDIPGTPYTGNGVYRWGSSTAPAIMDRSPSGVYTHSGTPSPSQLASYALNAPLPKQQQSMPPISPHLLALLHKEPAIPRAIPAPSSPLKPLDRSLENKNGETNVYIRGLLPETTDEMLHAWGSRFGDIQSSKSIIDLKTNLCKGFGFIKYHNFEDAENCIRGFHYLGYEVSFARESFYAKLKKFADENNTNLYVSNIPKNMNEHALSAIFAPHKVCSSKILRDATGTGRGVGFARFESREICEEIIRKFNNTPVSMPGGEEHLIQIRYADTQEQKMLKQQTAAGRVFRAAEYEVGVAQVRAMSAPNRYMSLSPDGQNGLNEYEVYLQGQQSNGTPFVGQPPRYRQPWAPAIPSTLGMSHSVMPTVAHATIPGGYVKTEQGDSSDRGPDVKADPATPVKKDNGSVSPNTDSTRDD
ncbi:uncharacterized protein EI97DRAFT_193193 [Westerdykella ornata]|uniref:RRM domain-containing protein n=1 Tax=Westerdykella ornata TaxID=318751 RepID=A0A6A6J9W0_WESOR|nr:uncharacterized protein EI97DRAFT_193193 [Westerdykella ornata]KAF2273047.1 hypothetical protein EI97DRAFT_193193 [Westerdykella ornata]